ncbi:hypothetical protein Q4I28_005404 [Leishmania naiffi]|uniref:Uncharacterized protein n=1 Tax=Leishmania naiffi TaxID=5678 RepID=A0AAW3BLJ1_9TRYP
MGCVTRMCCSVGYYVCLASICIYLVFCILAVPQYRFVALMIFALMGLCATSAWRLLPSEQIVVRQMAEVMARQCYTSPTVAVPFITSMTTTPAVTVPSSTSPELYRVLI